MDKSTEEIFIDILRNFMELPQSNVWVRDQNRKIPDDEELYVIAGMVDSKPYSAQSYMETRFTEGSDPVPFEVQITRTQIRENIQIDILSRDNKAILRRWEIMLAVNSIYAKQMQEQYQFKIARLPTNFVNTSQAEGGSNLNRFTLTISCLVWYEKVSGLPEYDYFDNFSTRVDDEKTAGEDEGLIEFDILEEGIVPLINKDGASNKLSFTRASSATQLLSASLLQEVGSNVARFSYSSTYLSRVLLLEGSRTNECQQSEDLANWTDAGSASGVTATATDVSGFGTMWEINEGTNTGTHILTSNSTTSATSVGQKRVYSCYVKAGTTSLFNITWKNGFYDAYNRIIQINLANETVTAIGATGESAANLVLKDLGGGIFKVSWQLTYSSVSNFRNFSIQAISEVGSGGLDYTGTGRVFYISKPQIELAAFPSSYVSTGALSASATRADDVLTTENLNTQPWIDLSAFGIASDFTFNGLLTSSVVWCIDDGTANNRICLRSDATTASTLVLDIVTGGAAQTSPLSVLTGISAGDRVRVVASIEGNNIIVSANGNTAVTDTSVTLPTVDTLRVAKGISLTNGFISVSELTKINTVVASQAEALSALE